MSRLFLASSGLGYIKTFVGKDPAEMHMLFIPTAGNLDKDVWWIDKDRDVLQKMGFQLTELDISQADEEKMRQEVKNTDIIYVAGGNTFYLLKQLHDSGFDKILTNFVNSGGLYAGASAGTLIAGLDIGPVATLDEPEKVSGLGSTQALGLVKIVPIPHYDFGKRKTIIDKIKADYENRFKIVILTDDQAIVAENGQYEVVDSPRSELEMEWLHNSKDPEII